MKLAFDTSAVVKLLVDEEGSEEAASWWDMPVQRLVSSLIYPESRAALALATRNGRLTGNAADRALVELDQAWVEASVIQVDGSLAVQAGEVAASTGLKGADAVHLATALAALDGGDLFITWDRRLSRAARDLGLAVAP